MTRRTRDLLAAQARDRGMSLAAMLEDVARQAAREAVLRSEREATVADESDRHVAGDERAWEATLADGLD